MRKFLAAGVISSLAALTLGIAAPAAAQSTPTGKAAAIVEPSVVYLEQDWVFTLWIPRIGYLWDEPLSYTTRCTGFVISPEGHIATAGHCVDPSRQEGVAFDLIAQYGVPRVQELLGWTYEEVVSAFDPLGEGAWKVFGGTRGAPLTPTVTVQHGVAAGGVETGEALTARVVDYKSLSQGDVALLKVESPNALPAIELADAESVDVGTQVLSVGYPGAADEVTDATYEPTFQSGQIASEKTREGGTLPVWEISAEMSGGMSGGPTTDNQGRVIGINSFESVSEDSFNFISPVSLLNEMLAQNGVEASISETDRAYRAGLNAFFARDYNRAAYEFQRVTQLAPEHQDAQEYLQKARQNGGDPALGNPAEQGGGNMAMIAGAIAGVLAIAGGAFYFLRRRRRPSAAPAPAAAMAPPAMAEATVGEATVEHNGHGNGEAAKTNGAPKTTRTRKSPAKKSPAASTRKSTATKAKTAAPARKTASSRTTASRTSAKYCPDCGTKNTAAAKFCESCGHAF